MEGMAEWSSSRLQMFFTMEMCSFKVYVLIFWKMFFCGSSNYRWSFPTFPTLLDFQVLVYGLEFGDKLVRE